LHKLITKIPALQRRWSRALKSRRLLQERTRRRADARGASRRLA
jgi:hypothetical protein